MQRTHQLILIVSPLALTWLGMMAMHELGHVLGAWQQRGGESHTRVAAMVKLSTGQ